VGACSRPADPAKPDPAKPVQPDAPAKPIALPNQATELLGLINDQRRAVFKPALAVDPALTKYAQDWAMSMAQFNFWQHSNIVDVIHLGFPKVAETVANRPDAATALASWQTAGNRDAILGNFRLIGVGAARAGDGRVYWCVEFGSK